LARTPRKWTGARSPSGLKRVRSSERRHEVLGPRRAAAKTLVRTAVDIATSPGDQDPQAALAEAMSALDRAAKTGAIHRNAAARRKSRLALKVNDLLAGTSVVAKGAAKTVGKGRCDVVPPDESAECVYLHVLYATEKTESMPPCSVEKVGTGLRVTVGGLQHQFQ
jgi:small subunit ribosomal protein S20